MPKSPEISNQPETNQHPSKIGNIGCFAFLLVVIAATVGPAIKYHYDFDTPNTLSGWAQSIKGIPAEWIVIIDDWIDDRAINEELKKPVSPYFDNKSDLQPVKADINGSPISQELFSSLVKESVKPLDEWAQKVPMLMPIKLDNSQIILIEKTKYDSFPYDKIIIIPNKGTEIIVPVNGAEIFQIEPYMVSDSPMFKGIGVQFFGEDGMRYLLFVNAPEDVRDLMPLDAINNAPTVNFIDLFNNNPNIGKGLPLTSWHIHSNNQQG